MTLSEAIQCRKSSDESWRILFYNTMKYTYTKTIVDEKSTSGFKTETIEATPERWVWGVVYKSTEKQIEDAKIATIEMQKELKIGRNKLLAKMREGGASKTDIEAVTKEYDIKINQVILPRQNELKQFGDDGVFHKFEDILKGGKVDIFTMYKFDDPDMTKRIDLDVLEGAQIFHFYRNIGLDYENKENFRKIRVHCFGFKKEGKETYCFILPDDRVIISDRSNIDLLRYQI